jgi:hypothetical protein
MTLARHNIRLTAPLDKALRKLALEQGVTPYAMLQRSVEAGIAAQSNAPDSAAVLQEVLLELAIISNRLADAERMADRTLFTACAAYCYARSAAMGAGKTDEIIAAEINRAYDRQRAMAQGRS